MIQPNSNGDTSAELSAYLTGYWLTDFANFSAFVFQRVPDLNWAGFYLSDGSKLRLGPFVGKPACTEISFQRGVCGAAYQKRELVIVPDVHEFPGHIACDSASRSEMVLPLLLKGKCVGVLDLDSPLVNRFRPEDGEIVSRWLDILLTKVSLQPDSLPW